MRYLLLTVFVGLSIASAAQKKQSWAFLTSLEINDLRTIGGGFSIHPPVGEHFSIGVGVDLVRVRNIAKNVTPVYIDVRYKWSFKQISPCVFAQGGLAGYNEFLNGPSTATRTELKGRTFLGSGVGFLVGSPSAKIKPYWAFKYRVYQFAETFTRSAERPVVLERTEQEQFTFSVGIQY